MATGIEGGHRRPVESTMSRYLEKKAWLIGRTVAVGLDNFSFDGLKKHLGGGYKEVETVLRLSDRGLSWGERVRSWKRLWNKSISFQSVELFALHDIFQETSKPEVLICIVRLRNRIDVNFEVFAFRLYDKEDVRRFHVLYRQLMGTGSPTNPLNGDEPASAERPVIRQHLLDMDQKKAIWDYRVRTRFESKKKATTVKEVEEEKEEVVEDRKVTPVVVHAAEDDRERGNGSLVGRMLFESEEHPDEIHAMDSLDRNRFQFRSVDPSRRRTTMNPRTSLETRLSMADASKVRGQFSDERSRREMNVESDDEIGRRKDLDLIWTRNEVFKHFDRSSRNNGTPQQRSGNVRGGLDIPEERSENVREVLDFERENSPPIHRDDPVTQAPETISANESPGQVKVYVTDYRVPVTMRHPKPLLKAKTIQESDSVPDSARRKKTLSFNPAVTINGTTEDAEATDSQGMTVTVHRIFQRRHLSWHGSVDLDDPAVNDVNAPRSRKRFISVNEISHPSNGSGPLTTNGAENVQGYSTSDPKVTSYVAVNDDKRLIRGHVLTENNTTNLKRKSLKISGYIPVVVRNGHGHVIKDELDHSTGNIQKSRQVIYRSISSPEGVNAHVTDHEYREYDKRRTKPVAASGAILSPNPDSLGIKKVQSAPDTKRKWWNFRKRLDEPPLLQQTRDNGKSIGTKAEVARPKVMKSKITRTADDDDNKVQNRQPVETEGVDRRIWVTGSGSKEQDSGLKSNGSPAIVTHDRFKPAGRNGASRFSRWSRRGVVDSKRPLTLTQSDGQGHSSGHLPVQRLKSTDAATTRPILLSRTVSSDGQVILTPLKVDNRPTLPTGIPTGIHHSQQQQQISPVHNYRYRRQRVSF